MDMRREWGKKHPMSSLIEARGDGEWFEKVTNWRRMLRDRFGIRNNFWPEWSKPRMNANSREYGDATDTVPVRGFRCLDGREPPACGMKLEPDLLAPQSFEPYTDR